jgi:hypothetical protein
VAVLQTSVKAGQPWRRRRSARLYLVGWDRAKMPASRYRVAAGVLLHAHPGRRADNGLWRQLKWWWPGLRRQGCCILRRPRFEQRAISAEKTVQGATRRDIGLQIGNLSHAGRQGSSQLSRGGAHCFVRGAQTLFGLAQSAGQPPIPNCASLHRAYTIVASSCSRCSLRHEGPVC